MGDRSRVQHIKKESEDKAEMGNGSEEIGNGKEKRGEGRGEERDKLRGGY